MANLRAIARTLADELYDEHYDSSSRVVTRYAKRRNAEEWHLKDAELEWVLHRAVSDVLKDRE